MEFNAEKETAPPKEQTFQVIQKATDHAGSVASALFCLKIGGNLRRAASDEIKPASLNLVKSASLNLARQDFIA